MMKSELFNLQNDELTRVYAAGALGMLGVRDGYNTALEGLNAADGKIQSSAIQALGLIGDPQAMGTLEGFEHEKYKTVYRRAAKVAIAMIENNQLNDDQKVDYLKDTLMTHPGITGLVRWGTSKLKKLNTKKARMALDDLAAIYTPGYSGLRHAASVKIKTIK